MLLNSTRPRRAFTRTSRPRHLFLWAVILTAQFAPAHQQPTTLVLLEAQRDQVTMTLHIPLSELELAFGHQVTQGPEQRIAVWLPALPEYLEQHVRPTSPAGLPWSVKVSEVRAGRAEQAQSGPFQEVLAQIALAPPVGETARDFVLHYDAILHQVVTHRAIVSLRSDWQSGLVEPVQLGVIAVDTGTARIEPFPVRLGEGSTLAGFQAMLALGARHIREGTDHLLFLLVLLLPSTLTAAGGRWGSFAGGRESLLRLVRIVTAFTLGHSVTLLGGALRWLQLPPQPVEVLIACSILVTAIHAFRPLFPAREAQVAAGFGLVHGLAFATVLADLHLPPGPMALSILGFNLGIELVQIFVVIVTMPWLVLLSQTPAHRWVRLGGAALAAVAAVGWILQRVSNQSNGIERLMTALTEFSPLAILILAAIAIPAYLMTAKAPSLLATKTGNLL